MSQWIVDRLFDTQEKQKPLFAFQGTVNWMRALSILVDGKDFEDDAIKAHYSNVKRRPNVNVDADNLVFENMLMAFHNHASLISLNKDISHPYNTCRTAIVCWYYSIYFTCSAMIGAATGSKQETHTETARVWQFDIVDKNLVLSPFSLSLSSLVESTVEAEISAYRKDNKYSLNDGSPQNEDEAWGAVVSYLKGTCEYEKYRVEEKVKNSSEFKKLGVQNFRKKVARDLRDSQLRKKGVNFLTQAFRYRGKANYRDSVFLSYGYDQSEQIKMFCQDLEKVSFVFQRMASFYLSKRVEKGTWTQFVDDLEKNSRLSIDTNFFRVLAPLCSRSSRSINRNLYTQSMLLTFV